MGLERFTAPRFALCEGDDDKAFLETLILSRGLPEFQVCTAWECAGVGGRSGFGRALRAPEAISGFDQLRAFLILSDNDDPPRSFLEVQRALTINGYQPPNSPSETGIISGKPVAVFMIPDANTQGDLESLCLPEIHHQWPTSHGCVHTFLNCTGAIKWQKQSSLNKAFARAATVGYYEDDPYKGIGHLFKNGTLSVQHTCFDGLAAELRNFDALCGI